MGERRPEKERKGRERERGRNEERKKSWKKKQPEEKEATGSAKKGEHSIEEQMEKGLRPSPQEKNDTLRSERHPETVKKGRTTEKEELDWRQP